jgi:hypothetical protein
VLQKKCSALAGMFAVSPARSRRRLAAEGDLDFAPEDDEGLLEVVAGAAAARRWAG